MQHTNTGRSRSKPGAGEEPPVTRHWGDLDQQERHRILLAALEPNLNMRAFAREHGLARSRLYTLLDELREEPERKLEEARREADFRREALAKIRRRR